MNNRFGSNQFRTKVMAKKGPKLTIPITYFYVNDINFIFCCHNFTVFLLLACSRLLCLIVPYWNSIKLPCYVHLVPKCNTQFIMMVVKKVQQCQQYNNKGFSSFNKIVEKNYNTMLSDLECRNIFLYQITITLMHLLTCSQSSGLLFHK